MTLPFKPLRFPPSGPPAQPESPQEMPESPIEEAMEELPKMGSMDLLGQDQVIYREGESCGGCEYFVADGEDCSKVQGPITSNGWCVIYKASGPPVGEEIEEL